MADTSGSNPLQQGFVAVFVTSSATRDAQAVIDCGSCYLTPTDEPLLRFSYLHGKRGGKADPARYANFLAVRDYLGGIHR